MIFYPVVSVYLYVCLHTCCGENDAYCKTFVLLFMNFFRQLFDDANMVVRVSDILPL